MLRLASRRRIADLRLRRLAARAGPGNLEAGVEAAFIGRRQLCISSANASGATQGESATAGNVTLQAFGGGTLSVTGNTDLTAVGTGGFSSTEGLASGDGTGGTILVQSTSGGNMTLGGSLSADATGRGGGIGETLSGAGVDGGDGFGGTVNVFTSGGSTMSVAGCYQFAEPMAAPPARSNASLASELAELAMAERSMSRRIAGLTTAWPSAVSCTFMPMAKAATRGPVTAAPGSAETLISRRPTAAA